VSCYDAKVIGLYRMIWTRRSCV